MMMMTTAIVFFSTAAGDAWYDEVAGPEAAAAMADAAGELAALLCGKAGEEGVVAVVEEGRDDDGGGEGLRRLFLGKVRRDVDGDGLAVGDFAEARPDLADDSLVCSVSACGGADGAIFFGARKQGSKRHSRDAP